MTLLADVNCSGSQEDLVSKWEPAHSLVEDAISGVRLPLTFRLWLSPVCLSASAGDGPAHSPLALLLNSLSPLFCKWAQACLRLKLFVGKFSFSLSLFFFFCLSLSLAIPQFGLLFQVSSLRLPSGHLGLVLTLSNAAWASLFNPRLLVAAASARSCH